MHCVLIKWHPMVGVDFHVNLMPTPAVPAPSPWHPHLTAHVLYGWTLGNIAPNVTAMGIPIIHMGSDIANGIPHIPLPPTHFLLALLWTALSGSKSHFGPSAVQTKTGPIGAALLVVYNLNLQCSSSWPTPTGLVLAPNTVVTHMTLGDILGGLFAMAVDAVLSKLIGDLVGKATGKMTAGIGQELVKGLLGFMLGSPLGKSSLDVLKAVTPDSWNDTLDTLSFIPGFPGSAGTWSATASDGGRWLGNKLGDAISGGETRTDRLWGRKGSFAGDGAAAAISQPATTSPTSGPAHGISHNPGVEEF